MIDSLVICLLIDSLIDYLQVVGETVRYLMQPMATIFAGHLGETELNAVALANSVNVISTVTRIVHLRARVTLTITNATVILTVYMTNECDQDYVFLTTVITI